MFFLLELISSYLITIVPLIIFIILIFILYKLRPSKISKNIIIIAIIIPILIIIWRLITNFTYYRNPFAEIIINPLIFLLNLMPVLILVLSIYIIIQLRKSKKISKTIKHSFIPALVIMNIGIIGGIISMLLFHEAGSEAGLIIMIFYVIAFIATPIIFIIIFLILKLINRIKSSIV